MCFLLFLLRQGNLELWMSVFNSLFIYTICNVMVTISKLLLTRPISNECSSTELQ